MFLIPVCSIICFSITRIKNSSLTIRTFICWMKISSLMSACYIAKSLLDSLILRADFMISFCSSLACLEWLFWIDYKLLSSNWLCIASDYLTFDIAWSLMTKVVPCPMPLLSTVTYPPIFSMRCLQMLNPRPVPVLLTPSSSASLLKFRNNFPWFSWAMPLPESLILISKEMKYLS